MLRKSVKNTILTVSHRGYHMCITYIRLQDCASLICTFKFQTPRQQIDQTDHEIANSPELAQETSQQMFTQYAVKKMHIYHMNWSIIRRKKLSWLTSQSSILGCRSFERENSTHSHSGGDSSRGCQRISPTLPSLVLCPINSSCCVRVRAVVNL